MGTRWEHKEYRWELDGSKRNFMEIFWEFDENKRILMGT
jgi:hypothetical protein